MSNNFFSHSYFSTRPRNFMYHGPLSQLTPYLHIDTGVNSRHNSIMNFVHKRPVRNIAHPIAYSATPFSNEFDSYNFLIVITQEKLQNQLKHLLKRTNYAIVKTMVALERHLQQSKTNPDLIITDVNLSLPDGIRLNKFIGQSESYKSIPFLFLTTDPRSMALHSFGGTNNDFILTPFKTSELQFRIERLVSISDPMEISTKRKFQNVKPTPSLRDIKWLEELNEFITQNIDNNHISVEWIAQHFAMSKSTLQRRLQKTTGQSVYKYINSQRLEHARKLLQSRKYNRVTQVALKVGYLSAAAFSRKFKQHFDICPRQIIQ